MSALNSVQAAALLAVADAIKDYADNMRVPFILEGGTMRESKRDVHTQEQFRALAEHLQETAEHTIKMSQDVKQA